MNAWQLAEELAGAISAVVPANVAVYPFVPDTIAGSTVYIDYTSTTFDNGWRVTHDVVITVDPGLTGKDHATARSSLLDAVLSVAPTPRDTVARTETTRVGDLNHRSTLVTFTQLNPFC